MFKNVKVWILLATVCVIFVMTAYQRSVTDMEVAKLHMLEPVKSSKIVIKHNGKIFFKNGADAEGAAYFLESTGKLYVANGDGSGKRKIVNKNVATFYISGKTIVYTVNIDPKSGKWGYDVYVTTLEGKFNKRICHSLSDKLEVKGRVVFYLEGSLNKINLDGTGREVVINDSNIEIAEFNVTNKYIYYIDRYKNYNIFRTNLIGKDIKKINDNPSLNMKIQDCWIYYQNTNERDELYKVNADGGKSQVVNNSDSLTRYKGLGTSVEDGWIYFITEGKLYRENIGNHSIQPIGNDLVEDNFDFEVIDGYVYYISHLDGCLYRIKNDGTSRQRL